METEDFGKRMRLASEIKVSITAGICVLALAVVSRYFLHVELDFVSQYGPVWIYITYVMTRKKQEKSRICSQSLLWSLAMVVATALILAILGV